MDNSENAQDIVIENDKLDQSMKNNDDEIVEEDKDNVKKFLIWFDGIWKFKKGLFDTLHCEYSNCHGYSARHKHKLDVTEMEAVVAVGRPYFLNYKSFNNTVLKMKRPETPVIFAIREPPCITGPFYQFDDVFHMTMTHRFDSEIYFPYAIIVPLDEKKRQNWQVGKSAFEKFDASLAPSVALKPPPPKDLLWVVSNCNTPSQRKYYVRKLKLALGERLYIDQYGQCNKRPLALELGRWAVVNNTFYDKYKFYLAFENSLCEDYITEKFFNVLASGKVVPVVRGASRLEYARVAPPHSYIHVDDFASPAELADHLVYLSKNPKAYNEYFWWRSLYHVNIFNGFADRGEEYAKFLPDRLNPICSFCRMLNANATVKSTIPNMADFWLKNKCRNP